MHGLVRCLKWLNDRNTKHCGLTDTNIKPPSFQHYRRQRDSDGSFWHWNCWLDDPNGRTYACHTLYSGQVLGATTVEHAYLVVNAQAQDLAKVSGFV
jgi:hypothetical protein